MGIFKKLFGRQLQLDVIVAPLRGIILDIEYFVSNHLQEIEENKTKIGDLSDRNSLITQEHEAASRIKDNISKLLN